MISRNKSLLRALAVIPSLIAGAMMQAAESPRVTQSLDENWRFHLGEAPDAIQPRYDDRNWRRVDAPHDYVIEGTFEETTPFLRASEGRSPDWYFKQGSLPVQPAVYRKTLDIPATARGKRLWLEFDGVWSNSRYWLNGHEVGSPHRSSSRPCVPRKAISCSPPAAAPSRARQSASKPSRHDADPGRAG